MGSTVGLLELAAESHGIGIWQDERPVCGSLEGSVKKIGLGAQIQGVTRCTVPQSWPSLAWPFHICGRDLRAGTAHPIHMLTWFFEFFMVPRLRKGTVFLLRVLPPTFFHTFPHASPFPPPPTGRRKAWLKFAGSFLKVPTLPEMSKERREGGV